MNRGKALSFRRLGYNVSLAALAAYCLILSGACDRPSASRSPSSIPAATTTVKALKVGVHVPLTKEIVKIWGTWAKQGIDLGVADLKANGVNLEVDYSDDLNDVPGAQQAADRFLQSGCGVILAYLSRASTTIASKVREQNGVLVTNTYTPDIVDKAPGFVFRIGQNAATDANAMAKFCAMHLGKKSMAIFHMQTPAGEQTATTLKRAYEELGGTCFAPVSYESSETDFRPKLLQVKATNPGILYIYSYEELGTIVYSARELGLTADICTNDVAEAPSFFERAKQAGDGIYYTALPFDPESESANVKRFRASFARAYQGKLPDVHAATWYDTTMILGEAAAKSDGTPAGIRAALHQTKDYHGITGSISIRENGDVEREVAIKITKSGGYRLWKGAP